MVLVILTCHQLFFTSSLLSPLPLMEHILDSVNSLAPASWGSEIIISSSLLNCKSLVFHFLFLGTHTWFLGASWLWILDFCPFPPPFLPLPSFLIHCPHVSISFSGALSASSSTPSVLTVLAQLAWKLLPQLGSADCLASTHIWEAGG